MAKPTEPKTTIVRELLQVEGLVDAVDRLVEASRHNPEGTASLHHFYGKSEDDLKLWLYVRAELYKLLCGGSKEYSKERNLLRKTSIPLISFVAGTIVGHFGVSYGAASAFAAAAILIPIKLGTNAWCQLYTASREAITGTEAQTVYSIYTDLHSNAPQP
jgi:hypothetical protein